jgi:hypothetical protein
MKNIPNDWSEKQNNLKILLSKENTFNGGIKLLYGMHSILHSKKVYESNDETLYDNLFNGLKMEIGKIVTKKGTSIVWNIWHITRIEDMVANYIIGNRDEVFNDSYKLNVRIKDTGNAMDYNEVLAFSNQINIDALKAYRIDVGKRTAKIINELKFSDMKRKTNKEQLNKIEKNGGVLDVEGSKWLLDFWGNKNVLGLIMMPITRHQTVHLNDCYTIKEKYGG